MQKIPLLLIFVCTLFVSSNAQNQIVQNPYPKTINVTSSAEMEVIPDEIYVQIDLKEYKKKGSDKVNLETIKTNFLAACKASEISDSLISIASYEGTNYNYGLWRRRKDPDLLSGISYQIKFSDSKEMDDLIGRLDDDATTDFQIVKTSHSKMEQFRKELKTEAIKQAKQKAIYLTAAIGEEVGEAITINEPVEVGYNNGISNRLLNYSLKEVKTIDVFDDTNPGIDFKKIKLKYDVTVVFALK
jgi:uncharacterized protein YggE